MAHHPNYQVVQFPQEQIDELKQVSPILGIAEEGGKTYLLLKDYPLPVGCNPGNVDLLLLPSAKNGYNSILYFSQRPSCASHRNWNGNLNVLGRNWHSFSWKTGTGYTLFQMLQVHLNGLTK